MVWDRLQRGSPAGAFPADSLSRVPAGRGKPHKSTNKLYPTTPPSPNDLQARRTTDQHTAKGHTSPVSESLSHKRRRYQQHWHRGAVLVKQTACLASPPVGDWDPEAVEHCTLETGS